MVPCNGLRCDVCCMKQHSLAIMSAFDQVRSFNRFYTREIGLLAEYLPASTLSLAQARVLYELANNPEETAAHLVRTLRMDKAHMSRIVARFRQNGFIRSRISPDHAKHRLLSLTAKGRKAFSKLNAGTQSQVEELLLPVSPEERQHLVQSMQTIQHVLRADKRQEKVRLRALRVGDLGWITHRQAVLYEREYGWDWTYEGLVSQILGDFASKFNPNGEDAWVAEIGDGIVGSVFLMRGDDPHVARLRLLYVEPAARGRGVGARLVKTCVSRAGEFGYKQLMLWTNDVLVSARRIYQATGFTLSKEQSHRSFGQELVGQTWVLDLSSHASAQG